MSEKLTERQKRFIDYYIQYGNGAKAAREAGYSEKSARREASRLMKRPDVRQVLEHRLGSAASCRIADGKEILEFLTRIMRGEEKEIKKTIVKGEELETAEMPSIQLRTKAAELLGKRLMLFSEREEQSKEAFEVKITVVEQDKGGDNEERKTGKS